jgi:hypothetical protein
MYPQTKGLKSQTFGLKIPYQNNHNPAALRRGWLIRENQEHGF